MITEIELDNLINSVINDLSDDNLKSGVDSLIEVADIFAKAGMPQSTFENIRQHIIQEATKRTDALFINEKVKAVEKTHNRLRNSDLIITNTFTH